MSQAAFAVDDRPAALPFPALVEALAARDVSFRRRGDDLALRNGERLPAELRGAVADHKGALLALCDLRAELERLHGYLVRLRCEDPPKGTRGQALAWFAAQTGKLAARSVAFGGTRDGWPDPGDAFADLDQITALREDLADLSRPDAPYPLGPLTDDPFSMDPPRYYSGRLIGAPPRRAF